MSQTVQWKGDNEKEVDRLLRDHMARARKEGDLLKVTGLGLDLTLGLGDSLILEEDRLGVLRHQKDRPITEAYVTWEGDNAQAIVDFLGGYQVGIGTVGFDLFLYGGENEQYVLNRGDRLVKRDGYIVVSKAGKDHRN